ncbi:MAG TPA: cbb3-type cytochrome c oxidase N-terminal domain-containing protein, partial [Nevskiaceae bacterium]|nr:cbb3-type cytochrome c oxidase N-terminal domain-containing protein [Nevskiaceae bacterium]
MSAFWSWFVVAGVVLVAGGSFVLLLLNARRKPGEAEDTGHVWDEDLKENNHPLPRWWFNLFVITVLFAAGYLFLFPGMGSRNGSLGWTQAGQLKEQLD